MPNCIFHIPWKLDDSRASASSIRPQKMLQAFRDIGYDVAVIMGSAAERKAQAADVIRRMDSGERFDFVYSESSTMPTQLTEPNHVPISRNIDFGFFKQCRKHGVRVGLFYRDVYWKYPSYREIGFLKSAFAIHYYKCDLKEYERCLDVLFVPSHQLFEVIADDVPTLAHAPLPPGCDVIEKAQARQLGEDSLARTIADGTLHLLYVGGIGPHYGLDNLIEALGNTEGVYATFCVRQAEFAAYNRAEEIHACNNIEVIHAQGSGLKPLYDRANAALMFFDDNPYRRIAIPYKTFEYIAHGLPIISNGGTAVADFIKVNDIGWVANGGAEGLRQLLAHIAEHQLEVAGKSDNCLAVARKSTWADRARLVAETLAR